MADRIDDLTGRVGAVEEKVDKLSTSVGQLSGRVDHLSGRMDHLSGRVDQLSASMGQLSGRVDQLSASMDQLSGRVDQLSTSVDQRFDAVDAAFLEQRQYTEFCYSRLEAKVDAGFGRLERKLDQFIDVQLQTNRLVDRRLRALEEQRPPPDSPP